MPLQKQTFPINFSQGLDTKTDPFQIPFGKFLRLKNSIFEKGGLLKKRNGFAQLTSLPDSSTTFTTTFNNNLTAIGSSLSAYSMGSKTWVNKGTLQSLELSTLSLIKTNNNQSQTDSATSPTGLVCTAYTDNISGSPVYKYVVADVTTGQNVVAPTTITNGSGSPRVFILGNYFVVVFTSTITATAHLQFIAINFYTLTAGAATDISTNYTASSTVAFDGVVTNNSLYVAWNGNDGGNAIRMTYIDSTLAQHNTVIFAGRVATIMSVCADISGSTPIIYASFYDSASSTAYTLAVNPSLVTILAPTQFLATGTILNVTCAAGSGICTNIYETSNAYSYDAAIKTNFVSKKTVTQAGVVGAAVVVLRSVGLASKAFTYSRNTYFLCTYSSSYQPTYFLVDMSGNIISKLAYSNGGGYLTKGLPGVSLTGNVAQVSYLFKDLVQSINKTQGASNAGLGVYAQTGINLATFTIGTSDVVSAEIGNNLHISGGLTWVYDGYQIVESGFNVWPDNVECVWSATGGSIVAKPDGATNTNAYFYQAIYEWSDNQGNLHRSAASIPVSVTTTGAASTGSITVNVPTLRLTYKTANPVKIVIYRWSVAQQTYYQVTSITTPTVNSTATDSIAFVDTLADASIIGNSIIYTTGGVIEDISPPSFSVVSLYKSRLFGVDSEDRNLLWYSKQVIEATPVEMSDLLTIYIAPTQAAKGSTGAITALSSMDDKLIIFKKDAIYYITGNGPDNTGANNDFSDPIFITSTVGCTNPQSIVFMPEGLMFQSDKGIWLLNRRLATSYVGAPVDDFNSFEVLSALSVPATNQVRFTLSNGITLMYDYYFQQWGTFTGIPSVSSVIFEDLHTYVDSYGRVFQENIGSYLDGSTPVLMGFTTGWLNFSGLQGFERAYSFSLLGKYISPHKLACSVAYDFNGSPPQTSIVNPDNYTNPYGNDPLYGSTQVFGGISSLEHWEVFFRKQKCISYQIGIDEVFDSSFGTAAGEGLTLSGLNFLFGVKGKYSRIIAARSVG